MHLTRAPRSSSPFILALGGVIVLLGILYLLGPRAYEPLLRLTGADQPPSGWSEQLVGRSLAEIRDEIGPPMEEKAGDGMLSWSSEHWWGGHIMLIRFAPCCASTDRAVDLVAYSCVAHPDSGRPSLFTRIEQICNRILHRSKSGRPAP